VDKIEKLLEYLKETRAKKGEGAQAGRTTSETEPPGHG